MNTSENTFASVLYYRYNLNSFVKVLKQFAKIYSNFICYYKLIVLLIPITINNFTIKFLLFAASKEVTFIANKYYIISLTKFMQLHIKNKITSNKLGFGSRED